MKKDRTFTDIRIKLYFLSGSEVYSGKGAKVYKRIFMHKVYHRDAQ